MLTQALAGSDVGFHEQKHIPMDFLTSHVRTSW